MKNIIKRSGKEVPFDEEKILKAIQKANNSVDEENKINDEKISHVVSKVVSFIKKSENDVGVEEIQDRVEEELMKAKAYLVSKNYIKYRYLKELKRDKYKSLMKSVKEKLLAENTQNQNANIDEHSFGGRIGEASDVVTKRYALEYLVSPMARENHLNNEIYIHDLNSYSVGCHNCSSIPFDDLLKNGFNTRQTDVRPAQSVSTAFQLIAVIFQLQSLQQFGGVSATHLDWTMVPYVRKSFYKYYKDGLKYIDNKDASFKFDFIPEDRSIEDEEYKNHAKVYEYALDMTNREVYQAVEGMYHNLNTLQSRSGN